MSKKTVPTLSVACLLLLLFSFLTIGNWGHAQTTNAALDCASASFEAEVCMHITSFNNATTVVADLVDLGVKWVRIDWVAEQKMVDFMQTMHANNISVLAIIDSNTLENQPVNMSTWETNVTSIMQTPCAKYVDAWEIWNEPNSPQYPQAYFTPQAYHDLLASAYAVIKSHSNASVVAAGLTPNGNWGINALYACGDTANYVDIQGVHLYGDVESNLATLAAAKQLTGKPLWVTEYGRPSSGASEYTEANQAKWLQDNFVPLHSDADKIFWYEMYDETIQNSLKENSFGLIALDGTRKPVFYALSAQVQFADASSMVGAYYYPWWGIPSNNHWTENVKGTPYSGYYNSNDPNIANQQIQLAQRHGVGFFAASWIGQGTWHDGDFALIDQNLRNGLLKAPCMSGFKFCLLYETVLVLDNALADAKNVSTIFLDDFAYATQNYFCNPSYLKVDGAPVLFLYNLPYLYENLGENETQALLDCARQQAKSQGFDLYLIGDLNGGPAPPDADSPMFYFLNATTSYHFDDKAENWSQLLADAETCYPQWRSTMETVGIGFVPNAYPGFNNTQNAGASVPWAVLPPSAASFEQMLQTALNNTSSSLGFVMVTSWNEWLEGTQIESSTTSGTVFLEAIKGALSTFRQNQTLDPEPSPIPELSFWVTLLGIVAVTMTILVLKLAKPKQNRVCQAEPK
ncbi:MAG: glycoside hydrolase family 99-like domain-containing protein [Candidatus Bathyarchaeia archaeon]|jgi:hypothetical protein